MAKRIDLQKISRPFNKEERCYSRRNGSEHDQVDVKCYRELEVDLGVGGGSVLASNPL